MLYGQIKIADFYEDNDHAIIGALKGTALGGLIGALKDGKQEEPFKSRIRNIGRSAVIGGLGGGLSGAYFDNQENVDDLHKRINDMEDTIRAAAQQRR